ncbi:hypothetical protein TWF788_003836 [Orbilia oligospora]|uniref:60S ribosomal protein L41 n=1 Tax=Orbilia oligospora TaxID=2813651 RepID=A0A7C8Q047_ORBOL|nr:hypothetical protein TWF788_003836 [Orbilia oligospora]
MSKKKLDFEDYTVGWICPLLVERIAAMAMFDEEHEPPGPQPSADHNVYYLGNIQSHNVVIAGLHKAGNSSAATAVAQMMITFPNLKFGLLVGIGGGVPVKTDNGRIRLGDVIVSKPTGEHSGAVQYDHGKAETGRFRRTGILAPPPRVLLNAAFALEARRSMMREDPVWENIRRIDTSIRTLRKYKYPGSKQDHLYKPSCIHPDPKLSCSECGCDPAQRIQDSSFDSDEDERESRVVVHMGTIASGELVIKNGGIRDQLAEEYGVLCFEMEAAGALTDFPCIVIRGISDYSDSHKNDVWHGYAAAAAAAYARQLFFHMPIDDVKRYVSSVAEKVLDQIEQRKDSKERWQILNWLETFDHSLQQSDNLKKRQSGTGLWLLNSNQFQTWLESSRQTLFCPGFPGQGKTIMTSIIIENLQMRFRGDKTIGIAYLYFNFKRTNEENLLASLLKQLSQNQPSIPDEVKSLYREFGHKRPPKDKIYEVLQTLLSKLSKVFIVLDALDECNPADRSELLTELFHLQTKCGVNILATSRFIPDVEERFEGSIVLEVQGNPEDIYNYIGGRMPELRLCVRRDPGLQEEIKKGITEAVDGMFLLAQLYLESLQDEMSKGDIQRALEKFRKQTQGSEEKGKLKVLADAYTEAMKRIGQQGNKAQNSAKRTLSWIVCANRPLKTFELRHALAVTADKSDLNEDDCPEIDDVISICVGLVVVDTESNIIRLVHYTAQEYLKAHAFWIDPGPQENVIQNNDITTIHIHRHITETCITYLSFDAFQTGYCISDSEFTARLKLYPLYGYAAQNWGNHARAAISEVEQLVLKFLTRESNIGGCSQALMAVKPHPFLPREELNGGGAPRDVTALHLAAYFGLRETIVALLKMGNDIDLDARDTAGRTPLSVAIGAGQEAVVKLLLDNGAKNNFQYEMELDIICGRWVNRLAYALRLVHRKITNNEVAPIRKGRDERTPLLHAIELGNGPIVRLLLEHGADKNSKDYMDRTPLFQAIERNHEEIVRILLENGVGLEIKDVWGRTPLLEAVIAQHQPIVELLLKHNADTECEDEGRTPLLHAVMAQHQPIVELLLKHKADTEFEHGGSTAIFWAVIFGNETLVKLLIENNADVEARKKENGLTPLILATCGENVGMVKLLLSQGAAIETKDDTGNTSLWHAADSGHEEMAELLLSHGAEINSTGQMGLPPLMMAAFRGHGAVVKVLLAQDDVDADFEESDHMVTPLLAAASLGHKKVVEMLLATGAVNVNYEGSSGMTPLMVAAMKGHEQIVELLLANDAVNPNKESNTGQTALSLASRGGHEAVVKLLLAKGYVDLNSRDQEDRTPLFWAVGMGHMVVTELLLSNDGVRPDLKDKNGRTPLSWAVSRGGSGTYNEEEEEKEKRDEDMDDKKAEQRRKKMNEALGLVKLLLGNGSVDPNSKDDCGRTPLCWASKTGYQGAVELLLAKENIELDVADNTGRTPLAHMRKPTELVVRRLRVVVVTPDEFRPAFGTNNPFAWLLPHLLLLSSSHHTQPLINQPTSSSHHSTDKMRAKWRKKRVRRLKRKRRKTRARSK